MVLLSGKKENVQTIYLPTESNKQVLFNKKPGYSGLFIISIAHNKIKTTV